MNIKTNLLEEYINFVDNTKKQNYHTITMIMTCKYKNNTTKLFSY